MQYNNSNWINLNLNQVVEIYDYKRVPLSEMERVKREGVYPYCGANGILDYINDYIFNGEYLLLAEDGGYYGKYEKSCYIMNGKFWVNNHAHILQAIKGKTRNDFLMYLLNYMDLHTYIVGSTRVKLNQEDLKKIQIKLPPLLEQQKIVEILSTADKVIEKIDQMIEKIEKLKRDLIKELLTKGIWHKEFKDTERSRIPKKCETFKISDILKLEYGESLTQTERQKGGFPVLGSNGIVGYHNQSLVKGPGIVIGRKGSIGVVKWIEEDFWPIDTTYYVVLINKSIVLKWLSYKLGSLNLNNLNMATGVPGLNRDIVYAINLQVPDTQEQEKIVNIIETIEKRIDLLMNKKNIYIKIRKQLMNDLLTNKLEVNHAK